jgi:pyruvate/2-oxoacid:ferredoxin oxidoreductase alpha subunit
MISVRDSGWIQLICESDQEIMDLIIQSYSLAEDINVQLPVMVNYDGYYLSFLAEAVEIPGQDEVDKFLAPLKDQPQRQLLIPGEGIGCGSHGMNRGFVEVRQKHMAALERSKGVFETVDAAFEKAFGRGYGGQVEGYRTEDADIVIVTSGSVAGTTRLLVDKKREEGIKVGMVKIRMFRPFPKERILEEIKGKKAVGVLDRSICFGWDCGPLFMEVKSILPNLDVGPMLSFIDGLANLDITMDHVERVIDETYNASQGKSYQEVTWL